jgi:hypothetical protein|tara:strand:- start:368 stop:817 length:450 start_codon:yes stop_codon:yes gene_type:complete
MKKSIIFISFFFIINTIYAQSERFSREKIEAYKKLYLTDKLKLDPNTETAFWETYKSYEDSLAKVRKEHRLSMRKLNFDNDSATVQEYDEQIDIYMSYEKKKVELRGKLIAELKEVMSFRKTYMLFRYEDDFRREMMKKLRESRQEESN